MMKIILSIVLILIMFTIFYPLDVSAESWSMYVDKMPEHWKSKFGNLLYDATQYWENRIPGTHFYQETNREKADFVVQWASQYQGTTLGYYTSDTNNDYGKPYIAITLGRMTGDGLNQKFELVDSDYALATTTHELGHAIGLKHSNVPNDIMYPSIYNYDAWKYQKLLNIFKSDNTPTVNVTIEPYQFQSVSYQIDVNQKIESLKNIIYKKQKHLDTLTFKNHEAKLAYQNALDSLKVAKKYLANAEWTQKEGEKFISDREYEKAYFKYLYSDSMIHKAEPFVEDITNYLVTANIYEKSYQETKQIEEQNQKEISSVEKQKICFLFWCW